MKYTSPQVFEAAGSHCWWFTLTDDLGNNYLSVGAELAGGMLLSVVCEDGISPLEAMRVTELIILNGPDEAALIANADYGFMLENIPVIIDNKLDGFSIICTLPQSKEVL